MSSVFIARLILAVALSMPAWVFAAEPPAQSPPGITLTQAISLPATPITSREQLDAYLRDTLEQRSPLSWLSEPARQRFLDGLVFGANGVGGMSVEDLRYELSAEQAYSLLQLFGQQNLALDLAARQEPHVTNHQPAGTLDDGYSQLVNAYEHGSPATPSALRDTYTAKFSPSQTTVARHALGDRDLELLFRAAHLMFAATGEPAYLQEMRTDFAVMQQRKIVEVPAASDLYDALLVARKLDDANQLLAAVPQLHREPAPAMRSPQRIRDKQPSIWIASPRKRELVRLRFNMHASRQVIVLGSTSCHFSRDAAKALQADSLLSSIFEDYGQWVTPENEVARFDAVQSWNKQYPDMRFGIAYDNAELSMVERMETPAFYFLDHGRVVDIVVGWPAGGNLEAIRAGLKKIDLL